MPRTHSEVLFTLVDLQVAAYNIVTGVYGTPVSLDEIQTFEFSPVADNDQIKAAGTLRHLLSVITHTEFKLSQAGIDFEGLSIITGMANSSSVTTPNQLRRLNLTMNGSSLPYFGLVGKIVAEQGADVHIGLPVCMLDVVPAMKFEQNKFVMAETSGKSIARESDRKGLFILGEETAAAINFNLIFA